MTLDYVKALDLASDNHWEEAHQLVEAYSDRHACLIHAYLHRVAGDNGNARYWYHRAGDSMPNNTHEEELQRLYTLVKPD